MSSIIEVMGNLILLSLNHDLSNRNFFQHEISATFIFGNSTQNCDFVPKRFDILGTHKNNITKISIMSSFLVFSFTHISKSLSSRGNL